MSVENFTKYFTPSTYDENARNDWEWKPSYNFHNAYSEYIIPEINSYYKRIKK